MLDSVAFMGIMRGAGVDVEVVIKIPDLSDLEASSL